MPIPPPSSARSASSPAASVFPELLKKIGVERRVYTAGENKVILDPFQPEKEKDIEYLKTLQLEIHQVFISHGARARVPASRRMTTVFSGLFWSGTRGLELGLIDGLRRHAPGTEAPLRGQKAKLAARHASARSFRTPHSRYIVSQLEGAGAGLATGLVEAAEEKGIVEPIRAVRE